MAGDSDSLTSGVFELSSVNVNSAFSNNPIFPATFNMLDTDAFVSKRYFQVVGPTIPSAVITNVFCKFITAFLVSLP